LCGQDFKLHNVLFNAGFPAVSRQMRAGIQKQEKELIMRAMLAVMLAGALVAGAATEASAQRRIEGFQRPQYGYGEAYHGRLDRGNPDRNFYGPNVLHGGPY
jgi:hypothetical protein